MNAISEQADAAPISRFQKNKELALIIVILLILIGGVVWTAIATDWIETTAMVFLYAYLAYVGIKDLHSHREKIKEIALTIVIALFLFGCVLWILRDAIEQHWIKATLAVLCYAYAAHLGARSLRDSNRDLPLHNGLAHFSVTAFTGVAVAAAASSLLLQSGRAIYEPAPPADDPYFTFFNYYLWVLLDMIPALNITELLAYPAPVKPVNAIAGLPVLVFRIFVLFGLLAALRSWWKRRSEPSPERPAPLRGAIRRSMLQTSTAIPLNKSRRP